jgi:hypothetical protein
MKKLRLNVEELAVDQFQVEPPSDQKRGTVVGHFTTAWYTKPCAYCPLLPDTFSCGC